MSQAVIIEGEVNLFTDIHSVHDIDIPVDHAAILMPRQGWVAVLAQPPGNYTVAADPTLNFPYAILVVEVKAVARWLLVPDPIREALFAELMDPRFGAPTGHPKYDA